MEDIKGRATEFHTKAHSCRKKYIQEKQVGEYSVTNSLQQVSTFGEVEKHTNKLSYYLNKSLRSA